MKHLKLATAPLARVYCRFHTEEERGRSLSVGLLYHRERHQQQHGESRSDSGRSTLKRPLFHQQQLASAIGNNCKSAPASRRRPFHSTTHFLINSWQPTATTNTFIFQKRSTWYGRRSWHVYSRPRHHLSESCQDFHIYPNGLHLHRLTPFFSENSCCFQLLIRSGLV